MGYNNDDTDDSATTEIRTGSEKSPKAHWQIERNNDDNTKKKTKIKNNNLVLIKARMMTVTVRITTKPH